MSFIINQPIEIDAPAEVVWEVITDLEKYGEWNPFIPECRSTLEVGDPIEMRVQIFAAFAQPQTEFITEHEPDKHLCYGLPTQPLGSLRSRRCHDVEAIDAGRTRYTSRFELSGWLNSVVRTLLGRRLEAGFTAMTDAVGQRATELHTKRSQA
jgi:hypothetical protein